MYEIILGLIDLIVNFFNGVFNFKIEWKNGAEISVGIVVTAFVFFVFTVYFVYSMITKKGGDE